MVESTVTGADSNDETTRLESLAPSQILYLQQGNQQLYVQLIQILPDRNMGWLRPLCLCNPVNPSALPTISSTSNAIVPLAPTSSNIHAFTYIIHDGITFKLQDMRQSADLLWPLNQCQTVLDLDAIPILTGLGPEPTSWEAREDARQSLNVFIHKIWNGSTSP